MLFQGKALSISLLDGGIAKLCFDLEGESVNKINQLTINELSEAITALQNNEQVKGLMFTSAKPVFIVGADITEFGAIAELSDDEMAAEIYKANQVFNAYEDLPIPSVAAINGIALGGGLEVALLADYRVVANTAKIGFPEVKLGIVPGYGGTVRSPRIIGADNAIEWIAGGKEYKPAAALAVGMVDAVVDVDKVEEAAIKLLNQAIAGDFDFKQRKAEKLAPLPLDMIESAMVFETSKGFVAQQAGPHYPAPLTAVKTIQKHANLERDAALKIESKAVAKLFKTDVSKNLINLFFGDQLLMKTAKKHAGKSAPVKQAAVLGAGIMGGGIAYQSASTGTPIVMKDIAQAGIDMGLNEASSLLTTQVKRGRLTPEKMAATLNSINPTLSYTDVETADLVVEAVVENPKVKKIVLAEVEGILAEDAVLTSNTSTIPITELATALKRPENFCGMHFFNPVHKMPLVEIIRGEKTSDETIARTVSYALAMKKKPVVVNDCPGFLVNRVLFAYFAGFVSLLKEGVDFRAIDKAAERYGWPMGPAYLCDVVGMDTAVHGAEVMAQGFPDRMSPEYKTVLEVLHDAGRLGEKTGSGFYLYEKDKRGRNKKVYDESVRDVIADHVAGPKEMSDDEIVSRLMLPFAMESVRCLEEGIADSAGDLDMAMIYGIGFPPFKGGIIRYLESVGLPEFCEQAKQMESLGALYQPTEKLLAMAANGETFYV